MITITKEDLIEEQIIAPELKDDSTLDEIKEFINDNINKIETKNKEIEEVDSNNKIFKDVLLLLINRINELENNYDTILDNVSKLKEIVDEIDTSDNSQKDDIKEIKQKLDFITESFNNLNLDHRILKRLDSMREHRYFYNKFEMDDKLFNLAEKGITGLTSDIPNIKELLADDFKRNYYTKTEIDQLIGGSNG